MVDIVVGTCGRSDAGFDDVERGDHQICIGGSGVGKTSALELQIIQNIRRGLGVGVMDIHGDSVHNLLNACCALHIPPEGICLLDAGDPIRAFRFNPLEVLPGRDPYPYVLNLIEVISKVWRDGVGARMKDILRNCFLALIANNLPLVDSIAFLTDADFRRPLVESLTDPIIKSYWTHRFEPLPQREKATWVESSLNKLSELISSSLLRDILSHPQSSINFRAMLDEGKIVLINLGKGTLKTNSILLGALIVAQFEEAAMSRVDTPLAQRRQFYLFIDEAHNFCTEMLVSGLAELRKFGLSLGLATQTLQQLVDEGLDTIALANTRCQLIFRMSHDEARRIAPQLFPLTGKTTKQILNQPLLQRLLQPKIQYRGINEELEEHIQAITRLKKREAFLHVRGDRTQLIRTRDLPVFQVDPVRLEEYRQQVIEPYTFERAHPHVPEQDGTVESDVDQEHDIEDDDFTWRTEP